MSDYSAKPPATNFVKTLTADDIATLNDEIAAMARAGLPLDQGLKNLAREMGGGRLSNVTAALSDDLAAGKTLAEAVAARGSQLPPFYSALVAAGVRSGRLGEVLATVTTYARSMSELRATVIASLIYPTIILAVGLGIIGLWIAWVGPQFKMIFHDFRLQLPTITAVFFFFIDHSFWCFFVPLAIAVVGFVGLKIYSTRTPQRRMAWAKFVYATPLIGTLLRSSRLAAFVDLLAILVDHHVPLPEAFQLSANASSDPMLREASASVASELGAGKTLAASLRDQLLVPDFLAWMAGMGERSDRLGETLHQTAAFYRKQAETRASLLRTVLPAFAVISVSIFLVIFIVAALLAPMLALIQGLSGGSF